VARALDTYNLQHRTLVKIIALCLLSLSLSSCVLWWDTSTRRPCILSPIILTEEPNGSHRLVPIWGY